MVQLKGSRKSLVVFCPLPPKQNGIADYIAEQLPFHSRDYRVTAVISNADPRPCGLPSSVTVIRLEEYLSRFSEFSGSAHIYHIGNNIDHGYMLPVLYQRAGVVVIHDLGLHHLIDTQTLVRGNHQGYAWALWQQYGRAGKRLGEQFLEYGWKGRRMPEELRLNGAIIESAERIIVHSRYSAHRIRAHFPDKPVTVIPHHLSPAILKYNRARRLEAKQELGLPEDRLTLTSMGFITRPKQIEPILKALAELKRAGIKFHYVLAGEYRPHEYDVKQDIARYGLENDVQITGYLDEHHFFTHLVATDLILNLRYPSGGETSGTLTRALGMGRCCMVVNIGPFAEIPDDCAMKLDWNDSFATDLFNQLKTVLTNPDLRANYETRSRDWISRTHKIQTTTQAYHQQIDLLSRSTGNTTLLMRTPGVTSNRYPTSLTIEKWLQADDGLLTQACASKAAMLWWRQGLIPFADGQPIYLAADLTEREFASGILKKHFGYSTETIHQFTTQKGTAATFQQSARTLVILSLADVVDDPVASLCSINTQLPIGANAVVTFKELEVSSQHQQAKLHAGAWSDALECSGFQVLAQYCSTRDITLSQLHLSAPEITFSVRKISHHIERFPKVLYPDQQNQWSRIDRVCSNSDLENETTLQAASMEQPL